MSMKLCFRPYMYDPSLPGMLPKVDVPTLVAWGGQDQMVPLECAELYQQAIPGAMLHVIEGCGHWAHLERPKDLAELVLKFVAD